MATTLRSVEVVIVPDADPDASYIEQPMFADRLEAYRRGDFGFVGVRAVAEILIGGVMVTETITSPGLWGIEDDSGDEYLEQIGEEEKVTLRAMLEELGVEDPAGLLAREVV
jgi:hypothetical protein